MANPAGTKLRSKREVVPLPQYTHDEVEAALNAEKRVRNSYHSLSIYLRMHRPCQDDALAPLDGSMLYALWKRGRLRRRQLLAWQRFWRDLQRSYGDSGPMTVSYRERVSTSTAGAPRDSGREDEPFSARALADVRMAEWTPEHETVQQKWAHLRREERGILEQLIRDHIRVSTGLKVHCHDLCYIGGFLSGYKDNRQALAAGVRSVQATLSNLADLYLIADVDT